MSNREEAKQIIDKLPEYKIEKILLFLKGVEFDGRRCFLREYGAEVSE